MQLLIKIPQEKHHVCSCISNVINYVAWTFISSTLSLVVSDIFMGTVISPPKFDIGMLKTVWIFQLRMFSERLSEHRNGIQPTMEIESTNFFGLNYSKIIIDFHRTRIDIFIPKVFSKIISFVSRWGSRKVISTLNIQTGQSECVPETATQSLWGQSKLPLFD